MYIGRRNVEGGGRQQSFANTSFRTVAGVRGAINDALGLRRLGAVLERSPPTTSTLNYFVMTAPGARAGRRRRRRGVPTCQSVIDGTDPNCVP